MEITENDASSCQPWAWNMVLYASARHLWTLLFCRSHFGMESLVGSSQPATLQVSTKKESYLYVRHWYTETENGFFPTEIWIRIGKTGGKWMITLDKCSRMLQKPIEETLAQNTRTGFQCRIWPGIPSKVLRSNLGPELGCECTEGNRNNWIWGPGAKVGADPIGPAVPFTEHWVLSRAKDISLWA